MPEDIYEILALGARWWFLLLGALIVLRAYGWLRRDHKREKRRLRQLPDAGMVGEMVVYGSDEFDDGMIIPVPREGTLGCFRSCDIVVPADGVAPQHCDFSFIDGKGLMIYPRRGCAVMVDGEEFTGLRAGRKHPMGHGSRLQIGDAVLRLRLFEGLETAAQLHAHSTWQLDEQIEYEETQAAWEQTSSVYHQVPVAWRDTGAFAPVQPYQQPYQQPVMQQPWQNQPPVQQYPQQPQWQSAQESGWMNPQQPEAPVQEARPRAQERRYRSRRRRGDEEA